MKMTTGTFNTFDGEPIFYRRWEPEGEKNGRIVLLLHRGHEHSGRLDGIARNHVFEGCTVYSYDNRGHGETETEATYAFMNLVRDLDAFARFVCREERAPYSDIFVIANSVAGVVGSTWVHDYAPGIRGMALIAPAFKIKLYVPLAKPLLELAVRFMPKLNITSYVKSRFLTHDVNEQLKYDEDAKITPNIPARQLTTLLDTGKRIVEDAGAITTPTLVLSAGRDFVVDSAVQGDFFAALASPLKRFVALEGFYHGVLYEEGAQQAIDEVADFMQSCFTADAPISLDAAVARMQNERDKIAYGSLPLHRQVNYTLQRGMMERFGFLSKGIQIGLRYGFDSGVTLDYVYANTPEGPNALGRAIDKGYLDSIGWRGIRARKVNSIALIEEKIKALQSAGKPVRILDIAGGPARYLIELAEAYGNIEVRVRDYQEQNVAEGRSLAYERNLSNIAYEQVDAFDPASYDDADFAPNIVIVSGVFELFGDNALIQNAIEGITRIIEPGGYLVYTGQPWHPQLEQIANVLGNHQGKKWIMRRRSQYELDTLFAAQGFAKEAMRIDDWGIFTVSVAQYGQGG